MQELRQHALIVAARILHRREDAEDVAQEAMVRMLKARLNGSTIVVQRAFVTRVAVRLAIDRLRRERLRAEKLSASGRARDGTVEPSEAPPEVERLYAAIARLPPKQAAVITLRKLMELEYDDIGGLLGISVENCRSHCRLGMQRLREVLREHA